MSSIRGRWTSSRVLAATALLLGSLAMIAGDPPGVRAAGTGEAAVANGAEQDAAPISAIELARMIRDRTPGLRVIDIEVEVEARSEATQLIETTRQFIHKNGSFLTEMEMNDTLAAIARLENLVGNGSKDEIHEGIENLNEISRPYAERLMDVAVKQALKDKKI